MNLSIMVMILMLARTIPSGGAVGQCVPICPEDWHHFQGNCYRFYSDRVSWQEARQRCLATGGDLVSIHSEQENTFAHDLITPRDNKPAAWIGLHQTIPGSTGSFFWSDGSYSNFEAWIDDDLGHEPNNGQLRRDDKSEDCAVLVWQNRSAFAKWNDLPCDSNQAYICKKGPVY